MSTEYPYIKGQYYGIQDQISSACLSSGRDREDVQLMAVSKTQPLGKIQALFDLGHRVFGENRVQEASEKYLSLPKNCELHMIGHLQSNKAKKAGEVFQSLQSLDNASTALALNKALAPLGKILPVLIEYNTSEEASKDGVRTWDELLPLVEMVESLPQLNLQGFMTMAPFTQDTHRIRDSFKKLYTLRAKINIEIARELPVLSMGMSNDFMIAIEEGSTLVRIGTAIFGERT